MKCYQLRRQNDLNICHTVTSCCCVTSVSHYFPESRLKFLKKTCTIKDPFAFQNSALAMKQKLVHG